MHNPEQYLDGSPCIVLAPMPLLIYFRGHALAFHDEVIKIGVESYIELDRTEWARGQRCQILILSWQSLCFFWVSLS